MSVIQCVVKPLALAMGSVNTKQLVYQKPTLESLEVALCKMKTLCVLMGVTKIAMPTIGCGIDRLDWKDVSVLIQKVFANSDVEILVCIK